MILYKYVSYSTASLILKNKSLWFSAASKLNDAFETSAGFGHVRFDSFLGEFNRSTITEHRFRILCLTRDPLSSIMWAHYSDQNRGVVIGIDSEMAMLEDEKTCALPAQYGSMIYTRTMPNSPYGNKNDLPKNYPTDDCYDHKYFQFLQRNFLYKSAEWHHEEEVRILKTTSSLNKSPWEVFSESDSYFPPDGFEFKIPSESIREIYLGPRFYEIDYDHMAGIFNFLTHEAPHAKIFDVFRDRKSWRLTCREVGDWRAHLRELIYPGSEP